MPAVALQEKSPRLARPLALMTQPSRKVKSPKHPVWEKLTFYIPFLPYYI